MIWIFLFDRHCFFALFLTFASVDWSCRPSCIYHCPGRYSKYSVCISKKWNCHIVLNTCTEHGIKQSCLELIFISTKTVLPIADFSIPTIADLEKDELTKILKSIGL